MSTSFQVSFGVGIYVGIYLDQNRQIHKVSSPKELFIHFLDEADHFLTGIREESNGNRLRKEDETFFKEIDDWFNPKKH
uniref:Uncharacterized protein n=1 Tax=Setaria digitata TaxID=48799 RepID=A0A915Q1L7_9BILA